MKHMFGCDTIKPEKGASLTKSDVVLLFCVLTAALMLLFAWRAFREPGSRAAVSYDGQTILQFSLSQEETAYYLVTFEQAPVIQEMKTAGEAERFIGQSGTEEYNLFACENGEVRMIKSSCPDLICVHHKAVSGIGETIICLPHKLVIEITGTREKELDGVVY